MSQGSINPYGRGIRQSTNDGSLANHLEPRNARFAKQQGTHPGKLPVSRQTGSYAVKHLDIQRQCRSVRKVLFLFALSFPTSQVR
jgi:hypothetical protein